MENEKKCFVGVDFVNDPNVAGYCYWYICEIEDVNIGSRVLAPLGRHNNVQEGVVKKMIFEEEINSPYPMWGIKYIRKVARDD